MRNLKLIRRVLVVGVGALLLYVQTRSAIGFRGPHPLELFNPTSPRFISVPDALWAIPVFFGILAEFLSFRLARVLNVGYYALGALYLVLGLILSSAEVLGFSESEHWLPTVVLLGVPYATMAIVLWRLYRATVPPAATQSAA